MPRRKKPPPRPHRDVILLRVSSEEQAEDDRLSLPMQDSTCRSFSATGGGQILRVFVEEQGSWVDELEKRPVFQEALQYAVKSGATRFVVYRFDRFARKPLAFFTADYLLKQAEVDLVSATEWYDPDTADGEMWKGMKVILASAESDHISRRVRDSLAKKLSLGGWVGRRPFGYCRGTCDDCCEPTGEGCQRYGQDPLPSRVRSIAISPGWQVSISRMVPRPGDADGYRLAVKLILDGADSFRDVCAILNANGYRTVRGKLWAGGTLARMLRSPVYTGHVVADGAVLPGLHEPLIDQETWARLQRRCDELGRPRGSPNKARYSYPLSGVGRCARCRQKLHGAAFRTAPHRTGRQRVYYCSSRRDHSANREGGCDLPTLHAEACEELVAAELDKLVLPPGWREEVARRLEKKPSPGPTLESLAGEEKRLTRLYQEGYLSWEDFRARWMKVQERRIAATPPPPSSVLAVGEFLEAGLGALWREAESAKIKRRLLRAALEGIYFDGENSSEPTIAEVTWRPEILPLLELLPG